MDCVNLKQRFGDRFKVAYEESYYAERSRQTMEDPWLMVMACRNGHICPWGGSELAACTDSIRIANRLKRLPFATVAQDGDDGANVLFDVEHFAEVAKIMKPRRRRRMTEGQKQQAAKRLREYQPTKGQSVRDIVAQRSKTDHAGVPVA